MEDNQIAELSLAEVSFLIYKGISSICDTSTLSLKNLLYPKHKQSRFRKILNILPLKSSRIAKRDLELWKIKTRFNLFIAHIAIATVSISNSKHLSVRGDELIHSLVELFYAEMDVVDKEYGSVHGDQLVQNISEREYLIQQFEPLIIMPHEDKLPILSYSVYADFLAEKRIDEYKVLWKSDMLRKKNESFLSDIGELIYQHWSGKENHSADSMIFNMLTFASLVESALLIQKLDDRVTLK